MNSALIVLTTISVSFGLISLLALWQAFKQKG